MDIAYHRLVTNQPRTTNLEQNYCWRSKSRSKHRKVQTVCLSKLKSCVKVEVDVLGSPSLISLRFL